MKIIKYNILIVSSIIISFCIFLIGNNLIFAEEQVQSTKTDMRSDENTNLKIVQKPVLDDEPKTDNGVNDTRQLNLKFTDEDLSLFQSSKEKEPFYAAPYVSFSIGALGRLLLYFSSQGGRAAHSTH
ncbi:MAG: hypothetical protein HQK91_06245 [Nitrospirae bacterium]|nr:hypothetical protein [Nitrospirota bacterium]